MQKDKIEKVSDALAAAWRDGGSVNILKYPHEFGWETVKIQSVRGSTCMLSSDLMVVARPSLDSERTACTR